MVILSLLAYRTEMADIVRPNHPIVRAALLSIALFVAFVGGSVYVYVVTCAAIIYSAWQRDEEIVAESSMKKTWLAFLLLFTLLYFTLAERFGWPSFEPSLTLTTPTSVTS